MFNNLNFKSLIKVLVINVDPIVDSLKMGKKYYLKVEIYVLLIYLIMNLLQADLFPL